MKNNKVHNGKEFQSSWKYVGQVAKHISGIKEESKEVDFFTEKVTEVKGVPMRQVVFDVLTTKYNKIKVELSGFTQEFAYPYSSKHKKSSKVKWADRFNKDKYPDTTYHLINPDWDVCQTLGDTLKEETWVEVRGYYDFSTYTAEDGTTYPVIKRIIKNVNLITPKEDGKVFYISQDNKGNEKEIEFEYICDFSDQNFKEINVGYVELGVRSTYQDETTKDTKVNAVYMGYGKEASIPKEFELMVYHKESGKTSLADAFAKINRGDFVKVQVVDNNRPTFGQVEKVEEGEDNPFADVEEVVANTGWAINGNKKGLEIIGQVSGTYIKGMLNEDELAGVPSEEEELPWMKEE